MRQVSILALAGTLSLPLWAAPKLAVEVQRKGDRVEVVLTSPTPLAAPTIQQRWKEGPHRFEVVVPKTEVARLSKAIDRGVLQKIETDSSGDSALLRVIASGDPKMSWSASADRKVWTLSISTVDIASGKVPALPGGSLASAPVVSKPPARPTPPPVSVRPPAPRAAENVATAPPQPQPQPQPQAQPQRLDQRPITVSLQNKDLAVAIQEMARAAGLEAEVGPGVEGPVSVSFREVPLGLALTNLLGKQTKLIEYRIEGNKLKVFTDDQGGATLPAAPIRSGPTVSDYFPIVNEKKVAEVAQLVKRTVTQVDVHSDELLNVLFVEGAAADLAKVRELLQNVVVK